MVVCVLPQLVAEEVKAQARVAAERSTDPYGAMGGIAERSAILHVIFDLPSEVIGSFESALAECCTCSLGGLVNRQGHFCYIPHGPICFA